MSLVRSLRLTLQLLLQVLRTWNLELFSSLPVDLLGCLVRREAVEGREDVLKNSCALVLLLSR